ncbi:MAG: EAL domain-containing protein [Ruminococcus sp.]|nr:EAL domain-containing protein [Ruminococcus sp.]
MNINVQEYLSALNEFTRRMDSMTQIYHPDNEIIFKPVCDHLGVSRIDTHYVPLIGKPVDTVIYGAEAPKSDVSITSKEIAQNGNVTEYTLYKKQGTPEWDNDDKQTLLGFIKIMFIIHGRHAVIQMAKRLTYGDPQMNVGNLAAFFGFVKRLIEQGRVSEFGTCRFNIKRLSMYNRNFGRDTGTLMMQRFIDGLRPLTENNVFRIGGDNFNLLFRKEKFEEIRAYLTGTPIKTDLVYPEEITMSARVGLYMCTEDDKSIDDIMSKITAASEMARTLSKDGCFVFDDDAKARADHSRMVESQFYAALDKGELTAFYQPKVDINTGRVIGAEALARWIKDGRIIPPIEFIPILERSNAICQLDFFILDKTCKDMKKWIDKGNEGVKCSVNLSRMHLGDEKLLEKVIGIIDKNGVPHDLIEIELTETTTDVDFDELRRIVNGLHQSGISASVDDFGVGYSSLTLIKDLPWDVLKIDRSFLPNGSDNDEQKHIMLRHVVSMAQGLGLKCIIEGVETVDQIQLLKDIGCSYVQGYYYDKPLPKEQFEGKLLAGYKA